jgi:hypothetical protein
LNPVELERGNLADEIKYATQIFRIFWVLKTARQAGFVCANSKMVKLEEMQASDIAGPTTLWRIIRSELTFLGITYFITVFVGTMTIAACGPGCCFVFFFVIAGVSGFLMLRKPFASRCICLGVLILSFFGMWHEKEARDSWQTFCLRKQLDLANELLQKQNTTVTNATNN